VRAGSINIHNITTNRHFGLVKIGTCADAQKAKVLYDYDCRVSARTEPATLLLSGWVLLSPFWANGTRGGREKSGAGENPLLVYLCAFL